MARRSRLERRYGFFCCYKCKKGWESSHVYCRKNSDYVVFKQECNQCQTACKPYRVEDIECFVCGGAGENCTCTKDMKKKKRHINPKKPHKSHLCHKCRAGMPCQDTADYYSCPCD